ncbi:MAG: cyclase family protein [Chitinophagaceae bacterium]|nr:cyclase family protein [Chitinophagaceae bacterium]MCA6459673.1 cyclase family protein [Chitinophagaceae bacterium]MCA6464540.1 cyclase family protein [Chitinophagaceae bacterium]
MNPIFLSHTLNENTPAYGGVTNSVVVERVNEIAKGNTSNNLKITLPVHIGTHIDFPYHFSDTGKKSHQYPASYWIFEKVGFLECHVDEVPDRLDTLGNDIELLILKTGFGKVRYEREYWEKQPVIPASFAGLFRSKFPRLRVFGFDMISLTSKLDRVEGKNAHIEFLLTHEILVIEDMKLDALSGTPKRVIVSPIQIEGADGAPCNIIAY